MYVEHDKTFTEVLLCFSQLKVAYYAKENERYYGDACQGIGSIFILSSSPF